MPLDNSLPILTIELYTPSEIIEARKSFNVVTVGEAMLELRKWLAKIQARRMPPLIFEFSMEPGEPCWSFRRRRRSDRRQKKATALLPSHYTSIGPSGSIYECRWDGRLSEISSLQPPYGSSPPDHT